MTAFLLILLHRKYISTDITAVLINVTKKNLTEEFNSCQDSTSMC